MPEVGIERRHDGDDVVGMGMLSKTLRRNGAAGRARFALHLSVQNGLVTRHHGHEDGLAVAQAWAAPERVVS
jgi:uncharacterized protein